MTPKEKTDELVGKFKEPTQQWDEIENEWEDDLDLAKECALIAAQEVRNTFDDCQMQPILAGTLGPVEWDEVIKELKKL